MSRNKRNEANQTSTSTKTDWSALLVSAVEAFNADTDVTALQAVYGSIPTAARGKAQIPALKAAGANIGDVLEAFNNLPASATSRTNKPSLSDDVKAEIRLSLREVLNDNLKAFVTDDSRWSDVLTSADQSAVVEAFNSLADRLDKVIREAPIGTSRTFNATTLADLVNAGTIPAGSTLQGPNKAEAIVNADGSVTTKDQTFTSLSEAAGVHAGHSVNGWAFWSINDAKVGTLR